MTSQRHGALPCINGDIAEQASRAATSGDDYRASGGIIHRPPRGSQAEASLRAMASSDRGSLDR